MTTDGAPFQHRVSFTCNICGGQHDVPAATFGREVQSCPTCGSTVRMRAMVHTLSCELFGRCMPIAEFKNEARAGDLRGLGTSDWVGYAEPLARVLDFTNTFFHQQPRLDLTDPTGFEPGSYDFITSSDVFEHVAPPVERAFETVRSLLKPGGVFVFCVPYRLEGQTLEHFPELHDWRIEEGPTGKRLLNTTADGRAQQFDDLIFHGGQGATLEMREFSIDGLLEVIRATGWAPPHICGASHLACGTIWEIGWALPMALRPA